MVGFITIRIFAQIRHFSREKIWLFVFFGGAENIGYHSNRKKNIQNPHLSPVENDDQ